MFRLRLCQKVTAWLMTAGLLLAAALGSAQSMATSLSQKQMPAAAHCHDTADAVSAATHDHGDHERCQTLCQHGCAACCHGSVAALPALVAPVMAADAAPWLLPDGAPRPSATAADIFKPPRAGS
jgi:hypothetical protein